MTATPRRGRKPGYGRPADVAEPRHHQNPTSSRPGKASHRSGELVPAGGPRSCSAHFGKPLTEGRQLLTAARENRLWAAYEPAVRIGLRRGEVLGLRRSDVDLHEGVLTVRQALQRVGGELLIVAPKTQRPARRVALPAECVTALRAQQTADRKAAGANWKGTGQGLVFTTKNGTPIEPRNLNRSFEALCARAGVRKIRFHDLRHTCASLLHEQGADARMIMEVLGHSSIRVTMDIYTFVRLDSQRSAFDRVGDALRGDGCEPDDDDGAAGVPVTV
ncbi:site-specific integrase [Streptomyces sp. NPDC058442]|uniref:site-specific integrase n=1 Tax=Streptomyces sp. NPDC058442 TaxID=3346503 RepID=UPI00365E16B1